FWPWRPMPFRFLCSRCLPKALCHLLMTCSILLSQPCWFISSGGTGNFCQHSLLNLCPESIWFPSGRLQSSTCIASGSRSRPNKLRSSAQHYQSHKISHECENGQDGVGASLGSRIIEAPRTIGESKHHMEDA